MKKRFFGLILVLLMQIFLLGGCGSIPGADVATTWASEPAQKVTSASPLPNTNEAKEESSSLFDDSVETTETSIQPAKFQYADVPEYSNAAYVVVNENHPYFFESDLNTDEFESYSALDSLGRCGVAFANISPASMPTEPRGGIGQIKPSGWHIIKYDWVDGKYLYNRCHLIGYQLTAENANERNLITGTRYMNVEGMLPFENMVADYVKETRNHVAYRVTPIFEGSDLLAVGALMEGYSVEDRGDGICFCVFVYNVQPGVTINYSTGDSQADGSIVTDNTNDTTETPSPSQSLSPTPSQTPAPVVSVQPTANYIANMNTKKFHLPNCSSVNQMNESNKWYYSGTANELVQMGYAPCQKCKP